MLHAHSRMIQMLYLTMQMAARTGRHTHAHKQKRAPQWHANTPIHAKTTLTCDQSHHVHRCNPLHRIPTQRCIEQNHLNRPIDTHESVPNALQTECLYHEPPTSSPFMSGPSPPPGQASHQTPIKPNGCPYKGVLCPSMTASKRVIRRCQWLSNET